MMGEVGALDKKSSGAAEAAADKLINCDISFIVIFAIVPVGVWRRRGEKGSALGDIRKVEPPTAHQRVLMPGTEDAENAVEADRPLGAPHRRHAKAGAFASRH